MEYKIEFHPAALKEFCELDGSKKQTDLFAPNGTHKKRRMLVLSKYVTSCRLHERKLFNTPLLHLAHPCVK